MGPIPLIPSDIVSVRLIFPCHLVLELVLAGVTRWLCDRCFWLILTVLTVGSQFEVHSFLFHCILVGPLRHPWLLHICMHVTKPLLIPHSIVMVCSTQEQPPFRLIHPNLFTKARAGIFISFLCNIGSFLLFFLRDCGSFFLTTNQSSTFGFIPRRYRRNKRRTINSSVPLLFGIL